ncbi:MAG: amidohydrolase [Silanimonas sp.]
MTTPRFAAFAPFASLAVLAVALGTVSGSACSQSVPVTTHAMVDAVALDRALAAVMPELIAWRRDLHQHPELGTLETRTAAKVAAHLRGLGLEVREGLGVTGLAAVLKGAKPGPRIALRADMDALPVTEATGLPFASTVRTTYRGQEVGVMHACGHDAHVALLMAAAEVLVGMKDDLAGEVMFVFQPAEEGPPEPGQIVGAKAMIDDDLFANWTPDAVYGLHVWAALPAGMVGYRSGPTMASVDEWNLVIRGRQTHGARPWDGVDPVTIAAQVQLAMQTIVSRQVDIVRSPVVLSTGQVQAGVRFNIIPDEARMAGTLRAFDDGVRADVIARFERTAKALAESAGATAELTVNLNAPLTANAAERAERGGAALRAALGEDKVIEMPLLTIGEDFSQFSRVAPTFYWFVGSTGPGIDPKRAPMNHSPQFLLDESALEPGLRSLLAVALDALHAPAPAAR